MKSKKQTNRRSPKHRLGHKTKKRYRIRNWKKYNAALKARGSLTVWVDAAAVGSWHCSQQSGRRGASCLYSDAAIHCALTLQAVYHLPLRATVGLLASLASLASLFELMQVALKVPDFSTRSRRRTRLDVALPVTWPRGPLHLVVDSSGFKVYGEGEWKVRQHGASKRRTWRKLHLGGDAASGQIMAAVGSTHAVGDARLLGELLQQVPETVELEQVSGDGSYDSRTCYKLLQERGGRQKRAVRVSIAPCRGARRADLNQKPELAARNANLERMAWWSSWAGSAEAGRACWKVEVGYHRRSLAETSFFRLKTLFGERLSARRFEGQGRELLIRCAALNRMTQLGMPQSCLI